MNIQETLLENFKDLTFDKQQVVLDFIKYLKFQQENKPKSRKSLKGLWSDLNFTVTEEDITSARQEMWGKFPKELEL